MKSKLRIIIGAFLLLILTLLTACGDDSSQEPKGEHTHAFGEWVIKSDSTCSAEGEMIRTCECGEIASTPISKKEHTIVAEHPVLPTCGTVGYTERIYCSACGETLKAAEVIPAMGHVTTKLERIDPTCTTSGYTEGVMCSACDTVLTPRT